MALVPTNISISLPTSTTTLYTCPSATTATVVSNIFVAKGAGTISINLYNSATSQTITLVPTVTLLNNQIVELMPAPLILKAGDYIEGVASTTNTFELTMSIIERS